MSGMEKLQKKLKLYLSTLSESAQKLLLRNLEKAEQEGTQDAAEEMIIAALRELLHVEDEAVPLEEFAKSDFFREARYFASEIDLTHKVEARINPSSFDAIWKWIKRDIATPEQISKLSMNCSKLETQEISKHSSALCAEFVAAIKKKLKIISRDLGGEQKLANQLTGELVYKDLLDVLVSAERLMPLKPILVRISGTIDSWSSSEGEATYKLISRYIQQSPMKTSWLVSALTAKLSSPRLKIELATKLSGSDDAVQVAATVYAPAVHQALAEMEAWNAAVKKQISVFTKLDSALAALKTWSKFAKALEVELELPAQCAWGKSLALMKKEMSSVLKVEVEKAPSLVRKALRAPKSGEAENCDDELIADAVRASSIFRQAELAKDTLAMNGPITQVRKELDQTFEILTTSLVDRTRQANDSNRAIILKLHSAAIDIAKNIFDADYAEAFRRQLHAAASVSVKDMKEAVA
nr:hypothetical protein [uncultured Cohaesibacter sp.]